MSETQRVYNPTPEPLVIDADGHSIDAHSFGEVERGGELTERLVSTGRLLLRPEPRKSSGGDTGKKKPTAQTRAAGSGDKTGE